jgi:hypothetical protein
MSVAETKTRLTALAKGSGAFPTSSGSLYVKDIRAFLRHYDKLLKISKTALRRLQGNERLSPHHT